MAKDKTWICGDCGAINGKKVKTCSAPQHDIHVELFHANHAVRQLEQQLLEEKSNWYLTTERFVDEYSMALEEYLLKSFPVGQKHHPHDLAAAVASFNDAYYSIVGNMQFRSSSSVF